MLMKRKLGRVMLQDVQLAFDFKIIDAWHR